MDISCAINTTNMWPVGHVRQAFAAGHAYWPDKQPFDGIAVETERRERMINSGTIFNESAKGEISEKGEQ